MNDKGYHRLWSHRAYTATRPLQIFLLAGGSSAVQGSVYWWARTHRAHHRYADTPNDPYSATEGLVHAHIGWTLLVSETPRGHADASDLKRDLLVQWQHRWYALCALAMGYVLPTVIPGLVWGDWRGGFYISAMARLTFVHHVCPLVPRNGEKPCDNALPSAHLPSTRSRTPSVTRHMTPRSPRGTTSCLQSSPSAKATTTSTTSSRTTTATRCTGPASTRPSG
jgi:hypothetical protein